ncbi:hypothetical protein [Pectobacterium carotovorum]|uniref:hypothetical protein n=1 Tax=Pectobacterium carotovorum TaxID=554 RepID=UPI000583A1B1|nr:hypothetical protein [Pectobacterium carotovorum]KHS84426.1 hypothetical protein RC84_09215 [Pectobacterium carotovorum subsp. carotovorum]
MEGFEKLASIVDLYFSKQYKLYKPKDANGMEINKWFDFKSRANFLEAYLDYYSKLPSLESAIDNGCSAKFKILYDGEEYELKHTHQEEFEDVNGQIRGISNTVLLDMAARLAQKNKQFKSANSFDDVYGIVKASKISGFGELSIYDAAVRISAYLGFKPALVFLHAGAREGAKNLEVKGVLPRDSSLKETLKVDEFPEPLQKLDTLQLENFLCSFKNELKKI